MIDSSTILAYLRLNKDRFQQEYKLVKIGLFGSLARNEGTRDSDIDIIVEFKTGTSNLYEKKLNLKNEIQNQFNVPVDICREKYIKPLFKDQIIAEAKYV